MIEYTVKVYSDGTRYWYLNGQLHREDGPAVERANGDKNWYLNNKLHREDGPAVEYTDGSKFWYLNGEFLPKEEHAKRTQPVLELTLAEVCERLGYEVKIKRKSE